MSRAVLLDIALFIHPPIFFAMAKLAYFICVPNCRVSINIDQQLGSRTQNVPELGTHAYRCKNVAEFNILNRRRIISGRYYTAILADDNGKLRPLTDEDEVHQKHISPVEDIPDTPHGTVNEPNLTPTDPVKLDPDLPIAPPEPTPEVEAFEATRSAGNSLFGEASEPSVITSTAEPVEATPEPSTPPPSMSHTERIADAIKGGPKQLGKLVEELSIPREVFEAIAADPNGAFIINGKAKWVKMKE